MGISNPLEIKVTPSYQLLLDYWLNNGRKPSPEEAQAALGEWLENIKIQHNIYHRDVIDAMFRQVRSAQTMAFKPHLISNGAVVEAVDYDLGRQGCAYKDNDTCSYHYVTPPVRTTGNRGREYRNDGVDIQADPSGPGYDVFSIEDGEWLQYTVDVVKPGVYDISFVMAGDGGMFTLLCDEKVVASGVSVSNKVEVKGVGLLKGPQRLKVVADKGGFSFCRMKFASE